MLKDWGSWDDDFRAMTKELRSSLLDLLGEGADAFDCVPMQGSGSFSVEAMLASFIPSEGKALVLANGAYGQRSAQTLQYLGRDHIVLDKGDYLPPRGDEVARILADDPAITHVVANSLRNQLGYLEPRRGNIRGHLCSRSQAVDRLDVCLRRDRAQTLGYSI